MELLEWKKIQYLKFKDILDITNSSLETEEEKIGELEELDL